MAISPADDPDAVVLAFQRFLVIDRCPDAWTRFDLYLLCDEEVVFYVGQSHCAFDQVWQHIRDGFKGRSAIGRFLLCNWPVSRHFTVVLLSSRSNQFARIAHDLDAAERDLIQRWSPCLNDALNSRPTPLPPRYAGPTAGLRCSRSLAKLVRQAEVALQTDARRQWLETNG